ncbi:hypothetical protein [Micromonospora sp. NPDC023633]|uniref:hypothetical protein n=1 Tax=Micromonospora sp. NPDC023633 TaxID=3154320 RepID=UPI003408AEF6
MSASTVRRWLGQDAIKPWQHRSWIFITDPDFRPKAVRVLDLYARAWDGEPLGADEYVISADEKTSIQARCRCHPTLVPGQARAMRVNHTYGRGGALAYLAAYDVHRAAVFGHTEPTTGIAPFMTLVTQVMSQEPYASAKRVFWIVDNGSSHRGKAAADRLAAAFPNTVVECEGGGEPRVERVGEGSFRRCTLRSCRWIPSHCRNTGAWNPARTDLVPVDDLALPPAFEAVTAWAGTGLVVRATELDVATWRLPEPQWAGGRGGPAVRPCTVQV